MRALFVVDGSLDAPHTRARVHALLPALAALGVESRVLEPGPARRWRMLPEARAADVVVLQRVLPPRPLLAVLARTAHALVLDLDDALGTIPALRRRLDAAAAAAHAIVVGNDELARAFEPSRVTVVPTVVDPDAYAPAIARAGPLRLGWIGTPQNLPYLELVRPALAALRRDGVDLELRVISEVAPAWDDVPVVHVPWTRVGAATALRDLDVGLAPLPDTEWTRGKCGYKALEYMASSLPVVASPVGALAAIVIAEETGLHATDAESWAAQLVRLAGDPALRASLGAAGRRRVEERYSVAVAAPALAAVLERAASSAKSRA